MLPMGVSARPLPRRPWRALLLLLRERHEDVRGGSAWGLMMRLFSPSGPVYMGYNALMYK